MYLRRLVGLYLCAILMTEWFPIEEGVGNLFSVS